MQCKVVGADSKVCVTTELAGASVTYIVET